MPGEEPTLPISRGKSREINLRDSDKDMETETLLARLLWTDSSTCSRSAGSSQYLSEFVAKDAAESAESANSVVVVRSLNLGEVSVPGRWS